MEIRINKSFLKKLSKLPQNQRKNWRFYFL